MSDIRPHTVRPHSEKKPALLLAEFSDPASLMRAAEKFRDLGYKRFDCHTPYPVHGMDRAMGMSDSKVGWVVLMAGLTGCSCAALMIWWMNGVDYPLVIGGKPPFSIPSMIPIMFELTVLFSAFGAFLSMLHFNQLPRHHHPIFNSEHFSRCSDDKFFISVESSDPLFDQARTRAVLEGAHPDHLELVYDEDKT